MLKNAKDWLDLMGTRTDEPRWLDVEKHFAVSAGKIQLIHGIGRLLVKKAGVYVYVIKAPRGVPGPLEVTGAGFALNGGRGGSPYTGDLPYEISRSDSLSDLINRLGAEQAGNRVGLAQWRIGDIQLSVNFNAAGNSIQEVTLGLSIDAIVEKWRETEVRLR